MMGKPGRPPGSRQDNWTHTEIVRLIKLFVTERPMNTSGVAFQQLASSVLPGRTKPAIQTFVSHRLRGELFAYLPSMYGDDLSEMTPSQCEFLIDYVGDGHESLKRILERRWMVATAPRPERRRRSPSPRRLPFPPLPVRFVSRTARGPSPATSTTRASRAASVAPAAAASSSAARSDHSPSSLHRESTHRTSSRRRSHHRRESSEDSDDSRRRSTSRGQRRRRSRPSSESDESVVVARHRRSRSKSPSPKESLSSKRRRRISSLSLRRRRTAERDRDGDEERHTPQSAQRRLRYGPSKAEGGCLSGGGFLVSPDEGRDNDDSQRIVLVHSSNSEPEEGMLSGADQHNEEGEEDERASSPCADLVAVMMEDEEKEDQSATTQPVSSTPVVAKSNARPSSAATSSHSSTFRVRTSSGLARDGPLTSARSPSPSPIRDRDFSIFSLPPTTPSGAALAAARNASTTLESSPLAARLSTVTVVEVFSAESEAEFPSDCHFRAAELPDGEVLLVHRHSTSELDWSVEARTGNPKEVEGSEGVVMYDIVRSGKGSAALSPILVHASPSAARLRNMTTGEDEVLPVIYKRTYL